MLQQTSIPEAASPAVLDHSFQPEALQPSIPGTPLVVPAETEPDEPRVPGPQDDALNLSMHKDECRIEVWQALTAPQQREVRKRLKADGLDVHVGKNGWVNVTRDYGDKKPRIESIKSDPEFSVNYVDRRIRHGYDVIFHVWNSDSVADAATKVREFLEDLVEYGFEVVDD